MSVTASVECHIGDSSAAYPRVWYGRVVGGEGAVVYSIESDDSKRCLRASRSGVCGAALVTSLDM